ncbi:hypothetical protein DWZ95_23905 [Bacteroides intestinalis]|uniref:Uncharacterized protein n=1 Tax=Bacteroides intestinalis TaxID=329854 RepID=A0A415MTJ2_9BACE|nr:hypothetical protein DWZ95_23905 [Bacteroides intestinalis]
MKRGELAKKKRKGCLTALLVVWAVFMVKVIAVLNPGFPEAWRMVEAGQIAGFAYIWLLVFLVLLCCFVLWRIVPKGYFRKKKPETSRPAGEWAVSIPTHENPVVVGNPFRGIFIAGAAGSGKSESVAVPLLLEFIRKGFAGIVYDFKFPALDNDISSFLNATGSDLRHFRLNFSNPYRTDFVNPIQPEYVPNTSYAREYAVSIVANLTKESIKNPDFWSRSATDVLTACIWYLREEHPEICDIPHVLAMVGSNGTALLNTLQKNIITEQMVRSVYDALQRGADNQVFRGTWYVAGCGCPNQHARNDVGVFPSGLSSRRKQSGSSGYTHRCHQPDNVTDAFTALQPRDNGCHQADEPARKSSVLCHAGRGADRFHPEFGGSAEYRAQQQDSHRIDVSGSCAACGRIRG